MEEIDINSVLSASSIEKSVEESEATKSEISKGDNYSTYHKEELESIERTQNYE